MTENYQTWTHDEYMTFVLIHAAFADYQLQNEENELIEQILPSIRYKNLHQFHRKNKDIENINIIMNLKEKFCNTEELKAELINKIRSVFYSDGKFNIYEKNMDRAFNLIL